MTEMLIDVMAEPGLPVLEGTEEAKEYFAGKDRAEAIVCLNDQAYRVAKAGAHCVIRRYA
jgi:predicted transcriptional regulator